MTGTLNLVSVGPGFAEHITPRAQEALRGSDVIVAYEPYLQYVRDQIEAKEVITLPLGQESERARTAIDSARAGQKVALVSGGDVGIYAMAAFAFDEMQEDDSFNVEIVPGITSAVSSASLLGSPLSHDFATLSLSDLLCPWELIEKRACKIAEADLTIVLYNVQSAGRRDGIYKILQILLEHKVPRTLCGVVRNAYRAEQSTYVCTLEQLQLREFDMSTTIVVGNRFTCTKRQWMYTPRSYETDGKLSQSPPRYEIGEKLSQSLPRNAVWVFSGTSDGNKLVRLIRARSNLPIVVSVATRQGYESARRTCDDVFITIGGVGEKVRYEALRESEARLIIDATHPFAEKISKQLTRLSDRLDLPYVRYERPSCALPEEAILCESVDEAARKAMECGTNIFLATGGKDLARFMHAPNAKAKNWYVRVTPDASTVQQVVNLGIPSSQICAMHGPHTQSFNELLWEEWQIDCVITKESGEAGGFSAKVAAAKHLGIPLIVIKRPELNYPRVSSSYEGILDFLGNLGV